MSCLWPKLEALIAICQSIDPAIAVKAPDASRVLAKRFPWKTKRCKNCASTACARAACAHLWPGLL